MSRDRIRVLLTIFPWNRNEYLARVIMEILSDPTPEDSLRDALERRYSLKPPKEKIHQTVEWLLGKGKVSRKGAYLKLA